MIPTGSAMVPVKLDGIGLDLFTYRPASEPTGLMVLFHGNHGNAATLRDFAIPLANQAGMMMVAPHFPRDRFPPRAYQRGAITDRHGRLLPDTGWTTRLVPLIVGWALQGQALPYWLWGFSAGGQFLSRVAAFQNLPVAPQRFIIVSPSSHVQPLLGRAPAGEAAPYGMGGVFPPRQERQQLSRYLERPVTICVGADDHEATDPALTRSRAALRQGGDRLARAARTFDVGAMSALRLGCGFGWQLKIVPDIGHSAQEMLLPNRMLAVMDLLSQQPDGADQPLSIALPTQPNERRRALFKVGGRWVKLPLQS